MVLSEFGDDAVAELDGAVGLDAEFAGHLVGVVAFGHELEGLALVRGEDVGERVDIVVEGAFVGGGEGIGQGVVEGQEEVCAAEETEAGEDAAALPDDPEGFLEGRGVVAEGGEMAPDADVAVLPQLGTAVVVAGGTAHAETLDEVPVAQYQGVELRVCRLVVGSHFGYISTNK